MTTWIKGVSIGFGILLLLRFFAPYSWYVVIAVTAVLLLIDAATALKRYWATRVRRREQVRVQRAGS
jgi:hypothetical protein